MALFKKDKKEEKVEGKAVVSSVSKPKINATKHVVLPRITEKASFLAEKNVYTFNIASGMTKGAVVEAVKAQFNVTPKKVAIVRNMGKKVVSKGRTGRTAELKKAYVYLKEGDKIELV